MKAQESLLLRTQSNSSPGDVFTSTLRPHICTDLFLIAKIMGANIGISISLFGDDFRLV